MALLSDLKKRAKVASNTLKNSVTPPPPAAAGGGKKRKIEGGSNASLSLDRASVQNELAMNKKRKLDFEMPNDAEPLAASTPGYLQTTELKRQKKKKTKLEYRKQEDQRKEEAGRTVFVGNLLRTVDQPTLKKLFSKYGKVDSIRFRNHYSNSEKVSKGVSVRRGAVNENISHHSAYIVFQTESQAQGAVDGMKGQAINDRHITVSLANQNRSCDIKHSVYVSRMPSDTDDEVVRVYFSRYGPVSQVRLIRNSDTGACRGFGYVEFATKEAVNLCLQNVSHKFANQKIEVARCVKKGKLEQQQLQQNQQRRPLAAQKNSNNKVVKKPKGKFDPAAKAAKKQTASESYQKRSFNKEKRAGKKVNKSKKKHRASIVA